VGKAAISGWQDVLAPALDPNEGLCSIWPFSGRMADLLKPGKTVLAETYPAEFYAHLGVSFKPGGQGRMSYGKRSQAGQQANAAGLLGWAAQVNRESQPGLELTASLQTTILAGFGLSPDAEDCFDSVIGVLGMLNLLLGRRRLAEPGEESGPTEERLCRVEGWILGQSLY
jgi:hypothetical protein